MTIMFKKIALVALLFLFFALPAFAQTGSINGTTSLLTPNGRPMPMTHASQFFQAPPKQHVFQINDIIYVHIKDKKTYNNTANSQRRKQIRTEAALSAWTQISGLFKMPVTVRGDSLPAIGGTLDHQTKNQGRFTHEETVDFYMACQITDIRDNGNLVIEGIKSFGIGEESSILTVSGTVRPDVIGPDFKVESNAVADFVINEISSGSVHDTVRRSWGARLIEQLKPF